MSYRSLADITANGMCLGCGLCAGIARNSALRMDIAPDGYLRPVAVSPLSEADDALIVQTCPGIVQAASPEEAIPIDRDWGPVAASYRGFAADAETRFIGSSGGILSALCTYLLEAGLVDFVLHVGADPDDPLRSIVQESRNRRQVLTAASARYGPAAPLSTISELLAQGRRFAVVGKPCDIAGVRNLARLDPRVDAQIPFTLAFFCAGVSSLRTSEHIIAKYGLSPADVKTLRYRGHGCPGPLHIETADDRVFEQSYDETWSNELNQEIQFRCKICPDSTGEQSDIACGDAWTNPDGYAHHEHDGWTAILTRTSRGERLLRDARCAGHLVTEPHGLDALASGQAHQIERKQAILARLAGIRLAGTALPRFTGLRLGAAALTGWRNAAANLSGSFQRRRKLRPRADSQASWLPYLAALPLALLCLVTIVLPLASVLLYSFWTQDYLTTIRTFSLVNFHEIASSPLYIWLIAKSILLSLAVTITSVVLAIPIAYFINFKAGRWAPILLLAFILPFWISYLLRIFAWKVLLGFNGIINSGLVASGLISEPIGALLYSPFSVWLALVHAWLPFVVLPIYVSMSRIDRSLLEVSRDLGAKPARSFATVVLPLSRNGILAGSALVFIPVAVDYITPALLGGPSGSMIGNIIQSQFTRANNWPLGSALSLVTMLCVSLCALFVMWLSKRGSRQVAP
jgi:coenzyme F420 hydrogenase subunit beta